MRQSRYYVSSTGNDFSLQEESPAIDAGIDLGYQLDFLNQTIPSGRAPDIGAFERQ